MLARAISHFLLVFLTLIYNVSCQAGSLTFVIDDTRSMGKDIKQVRSSVDSIMDIVLKEKSSLISNIVLVTFNDPKVRLRKITNSREELKKEMAKVKVNNYYNNDCPEMALSGLKLALESSLPNSYVYVFTDASAKDYKLSEEIKQLCQRKQSQVFFVLTGDCRRPYDKKFHVYNEIANAGSGLAIRVDKDQVKDVLNTISETIKGNKTVLTSMVTPANTKTDVPFSVDDLTEYVIVSASGADVSLEIKGPPDHKDLDIENIMWTENGKVIKIKNPHPGQYVATVRGSSATSVIATGRSDFLFQHGFSEEEPKSIDDTAPQPLSNTLTHLSLSVKDPNHSVRIKSAQILDMKENVIKTLPLKELSPNFYTTEPFAAPSDMFKVAMIGEAIQTGEPVRRITKIPITPQAPPSDKPLAKAPVVEIVEGASVEVARGAALTLTCKVSAYPKPEIIWTNDKNITVQSKSSTLQLPYDYISYLKIPKATENTKYRCYAKNILNDAHKSINVVTKDPITVQPAPEGNIQDTKIAYGKPLTLNCGVSSPLPLEIKWYHVDKSTGKTEQVTSSKKYSISSDGKQLTITSMDVDLVGKYTCKAHVRDNPNEKQEMSTNVEIDGLVPPKISPDTERVAVKEHMPATIKCKILMGIPEPKISWLFKASGSDSSYKTIPGSRVELRIPSAGLHDAGSYRCIASNVEGRDQSTVAELEVLKAPVVTIKQGANVAVEYDGTLSLTCKITANPPPKIMWSNEKGELIRDTMSGSKTEFESNFLESNMKNSGMYKCQAENNQGIQSASIQVTVLPAFSVHSQPPDTIEVPYGKRVDLKCDIKSTKPMKIEWFYAYNSTTTRRPLILSNKAYEVSSDGTLKINSMDLDLTGAYTCKASLINDPSVTKSFTTNVDIGGLVPPEIEPLLIKKEIYETDSTTITCKILGGVPKTKISWQKKAAGSTEYRPIAGSGSELHIKQATLANSGLYKCLAETETGHREQVVAELVVLKAPKVTVIIEGVSNVVPYGSQLTLTCLVTANPEPTIVWKDGAGNSLPGTSVAMKSSFKYTHTMTRANVKTSDKYSCTAINDQGIATQSVQMTVSSPFKVHSNRPKDKTNALGTTTGKYGTAVTLKCGITSNFPMKIRWYHVKESTSEKKEIESSKQYTILSNGAELKINAMDFGLDGKYTCKASLLEDPNKQVEHTTQVKIDGLVPAKIISDNLKVYEGLIGDIALRIPCEAIGFPKPTFTWKVNGAIVSPGTKYGIEDGALIVKLPERSESNYTCIATNTAGSDSKTFTGVVDEILLDDGPTHEVFILKGESKNISCSLKHSEPSTINWFIEPQHINYTGVSYVAVTNAKAKDSGNYTCHVSDVHGSATETFLVNVGYPPTFKYPQEDPLVDWAGDMEDALTCFVIAEPPTNVQWTFNGEPLVGANSEELNILKWGHYSCNVSNVYGSVQRDFEVKPKVCLISRNKEEAPHMPLMLTEELTWPDYETSGEYMKMKSGDKLILTCYNHEESPNSFQIFPAVSELEATCEMGDTFKVDGKPYKLKDLKCTNEIFPSVEKTGMKCLTDTAELMNVGYNSVEAYQVCFDYSTNLPLYTRVLMTHTNNVPSAADEWFQYPGVGDDTTESYTCKTSSSSCCYAKSQLVSARDFSYGAAQNSSFIDPLNAIPYWRPCDTNRTSWEDVEDMVRYELTINPSFIVWSGVHTLQVKNGTVIPRYLWKVVRESEVESVALVYVNDGAPTANDVKCENKCASIVPWFNSRDKYTYCCTVAEFIEAFGIPGDVVGESLDQSVDQDIDYSSDE